MKSALNATCRFALGAALAVAAAVSFAQAPSQPETLAEPVVVAMAPLMTTDARQASTTATEYPPLQAGVRRAAAQGPDALRRYIHRTRFIFAWYYPDFAQ